MTHDAYGLLSDDPAMQPVLAALDQGATDADLLPFLTCHAVLFTDLSGFSTHPVNADGLRRIFSMERTLKVCIPLAQGQLFKSMADSHLVLFPTVAQALTCVDAMQARLPANPFCAGIGWGLMLVCAHAFWRFDVFWQEVSAASRLGEDVAHGREILLTPAAYAQLTPAAQQRCVPSMERAQHYWRVRERGQ